MRVIGAIGQNGSGKDEVLKYLKDRYKVPFLSTGDIVREIAKKEGLEPTRENLKTISENCFRDMGEGCFVKIIAEKIRTSGWPVSGISGIRSISDVNILKEFFGNDFVLIDVYVSDAQERYRRMVNRGEGRDPKSYAQFQEQDRAEEALFQISEAEKLAGFHISNDGTLAEMHAAVERKMGDLFLSGGSSP